MIGRRDQRITLERRGTVLNQLDEETHSWGPIDGGTKPTREWAQIFYGRGDERRQAAAEQGSQTATFRMLSNSRTRLLDRTSRIVFHGEWDIHGISPDTPRRGQIEVTAARKS